MKLVRCQALFSVSVLLQTLCKFDWKSQRYSGVAHKNDCLNITIDKKQILVCSKYGESNIGQPRF